MIKKRLTAVFFVVALALAAPATASAHGHEHPTDPVQPAKCNSGRGNLSETTPANDCDPGNSGGVNQGGD